jgi:hypothetical protein
MSILMTQKKRPVFNAGNPNLTESRTNRDIAVDVYASGRDSIVEIDARDPTDILSISVKRLEVLLRQNRSIHVYLT